MTNNGVDFSKASSDVALTYHTDFSVRRLSLDRVQVEKGRSINITAWGLGLPKAEAAGEASFWCVFGPAEAYPGEDGT